MVGHMRNGTLVKFTTGERKGQVWVINWANSDSAELIPYDPSMRRVKLWANPAHLEALDKKELKSA